MPTKSKILLSFWFLTLSSNLWANASSDVWQNYFPEANCQVDECAKNVPAQALENMLEKASYLMPQKLSSTNWAFVADFTQNSTLPRGHLINMKSGKSKSYHVAHGVNSGDGRGNTLRFSNRNGSKQSSKGLYVTAETYRGKHGLSLRLDGLESTNDNARKRAIVIHGASYVPNSSSKVGHRIGRSWGCPAVANAVSKDLILKIKGGSLYYIHGN